MHVGPDMSAANDFQPHAIEQEQDLRPKLTRTEVKPAAPVTDRRDDGYRRTEDRPYNNQNSSKERKNDHS